MKRIIAFLVLDLILFAIMSRAQEKQMPDTPRAKPSEDELCKGVKTGDVCAATGRRYYKDLFLLDEREDKWTQAALTPGMLFAGGILFAGTVADFESTQSCLSRKTCQESNPILGKHPSRARMYAIGMPLDALLFYVAVDRKKQGKGLLPFAALYVTGLAHIVVAARNRSY